MSLWINAGFLSVIALLALIMPLLRQGAGASDDHEAAVYEDQLAEIDRDVERGLLSEAEAEALQKEITRRLEKVREEASGPQGAGAFGNAEIAALIIVMIFLPAGAFGLYGHLGSPDKPDLPVSARNIAPPEQAPQNQELAKLAENLAGKMEQNPERLKGWMLLGRTYMTLQDYPKAARAFGRAFGLGPEKPDVGVSFAEALFMASGGRFTAEADTALATSARAFPAEPKTMFYQGLSLAEKRKFAEAIQIWVNLRAVSQPNAPWLPSLRERLADAAQKSGIDPATVKPTLGPASPMAPPVTSGPNIPGPTREDVEAAQQMTSEDRQAFIRSMVQRLADRLEDEPDDLAGWKRLARAYRVLGETAKAEAAEKRVAELEKKANP
ncbi:MAG: c-type cytochrome biogenesis protein CcmI [Rhodospirillaceae bacterium]